MAAPKMRKVSEVFGAKKKARMISAGEVDAGEGGRQAVSRGEFADPQTVEDVEKTDQGEGPGADGGV